MQDFQDNSLKISSEGQGSGIRWDLASTLCSKPCILKSSEISVFSQAKMLLISSFIFAFLHQISSADFLYSEMEYLGGSCYPQDSCNSSRNEDDDHLWSTYSCECGEHCLRYGTCCADSLHFGKTLHMIYQGETCTKLSSLSDAIIMVYRCSDRWRNGFEALKRCENPEDNVEDPLGLIPVTSLDTNVTYKNFYCAVCNHDDRNTYLWNISLELDTKRSIPKFQNLTKTEMESYLLQDMVYNRKQNSWGLDIDADFYKLSIQFKVPGNLQKLVKKCYRNMIMSCSSAYAYSISLQYKCWSYYSPIQIKEVGKHVKKYRNIHCALCNDVNITDVDMNMCKLDVRPKKTKPAFSFALLLDINRADGEYVGMKKMCKDDQKWDPFFKKCRSLHCLIPGYIVKDGVCVPADLIET